MHIARGFIMVGATGLVAATSAASPTTQLVGHWTFDDARGQIAHDSSGYGNHGAVTGAIWTRGIAGGALHSDGIDDFVNCGNAAVLNPVAAITVSAWYRPTVPSRRHGRSLRIAACEFRFSGRERKQRRFRADVDGRRVASRHRNV